MQHILLFNNSGKLLPSLYTLKCGLHELHDLLGLSAGGFECAYRWLSYDKNLTILTKCERLSPLRDLSPPTISSGSIDEWLVKKKMQIAHAYAL